MRGKTVAVREPGGVDPGMVALHAAAERAADTGTELEVRMRPYRLANRELRVRDVTTRLIPREPEVEPGGLWRWLADGGVVYVGLAAVGGVAVAFVVTFVLAVITALSTVVSTVVGLVVAVLLLVLGFGSTAVAAGGCPGLHCSGCQG